MSAETTNRTREEHRSIQDFVTCLKLPSGEDEAQVFEILRDVPEIPVNEKTRQKESSEILIDVSCRILQIFFGSSALLEKSLVQKAASESWTQTCWSSPSCVVKPQNAAQVSQILRIATFLQTPFAVRSGGHSPNPGSAGLDEGILIDLSDMNKMSISDDGKVFSVGPGARWGAVYKYLDPHDVTVLGGRVPQVGVGGLMLGGGISFFTGEYGLACDSLVNAEVVLADGSIVNANAQENSDLLWALKGGGPNFGIVTRYDLQTIPVKNIWYQLSAHSTAQAPELLQAFAKWQQEPDNHGALAMVITLTSIIVGLIYAKPVEKPDVFNAFYGIEPLAAIVPSTLNTVQSLNDMTGGITASPFARHDYRAVSSKIDPELYQEVYEIWRKEATAANEATGANMTFVLQHIPKNVVTKGNEHGGNALGLEPISQQWWTTLIDWEHAADDAAVRGAAIAVTQKWEELGKARGSHLPFLYMNDASRDQNPLGTYAPENLQRLRTVAAKYDPRQVFQTLQNGGFLLSKA